MQGPGGWVRLGFVLNWECLGLGVKAKPCIGHWDSCAFPGEEQDVGMGFGSAALGSRELLAAAMPWTWAGQERGEGTGCALPPTTNPQVSPGSWTLSQRLAKDTPFLGKRLLQLSTPAAPAPPFATTFMGNRKSKDEHESVWCEGHHPGMGRAGP